MTDKEKPKVIDLTGGQLQPAEKFKQLADGSLVRLEDTTTPKPVEEPKESEETEEATE